MRISVEMLRRQTPVFALLLLCGLCHPVLAQRKIQVPPAVMIDPFTGQTNVEESAQSPGQVVAKAKSLSADQAYLYLLEWVLPKEGSPGFKTQFEFLPLDQQRDLPAETAELDRMSSPTIELIATAKKTNKLADLAERVSAISASNPEEVRARTALLILIYAAQDQIPSAKTGIENLGLLVGHPLPKHLSIQDRAPEYYVILFASKKPALYFECYYLATSLRIHERNMATHANDPNWERLLNGAISELTRRSLGGKYSKPLKQWTSVPNVTGQESAMGLRPSVWRMERDVLMHDGGEAWSTLFFQSPLQGKFEIHARRSTFNYGEMLVSIGMHAAEPLWDLRGHRVHRALLGASETLSPVVLPKWDALADFKIVVDGNKVTTYTNDVLIHEEQFNAPIDPWLMLQAEWPGFSTRVERLTIRGTPQVPNEIDLVNVADAGGWRSNFYEYNTYPNPVGRYYSFTPGEIRGSSQGRSSSRKTESFLRYARPMLEDGEFEYEYFYQPDNYEVHPVIGKNAVLLDGDLPMLHPLSAGRFERTDLTPESVREIEGAKKLNLKPKEWNHVLLQLRSDELTIRVNGVEVATRTVTEPPNERFFGFFRYVNDHQMRVRNAKYRGDWPKVIPSIEEQELAEKP